MDVKLDWLSFTFNWDNSDCQNDQEARLVMMGTLIENLLPEVFDHMMGEGVILTGKGRKPYSASISANPGTRIYFNHKLNHALVEISGEGCSRVFTEAIGVHLLQLVKDRVTRVDIAADIETDVTPSEFVSHREPGRFKSFSHIVSDTGETCYIGSMSSNRYARVYKYSEPHPRAGVLRAEHVFRAEDAKKVIEYGFTNGIDNLAQQVGGVFGWLHDSWELEPPTEKELKAHREERTDAGTARWLLDTVVPVVGRLWKEGKEDTVKAFMIELGKALSDPDNKPVDRIG